MNYDTTLNAKSKINNKEKINLNQIMLTIAIFFLMFTILTNPAQYAKSVTKGLLLFTTAVLPGLLPFMFFTKIIIKFNFSGLTSFLNKPSQKFLGLNGNAMYGFFASAISGYPVGAKLASELYLQNKIDKSQLHKTALICSTSGPIFIIGTVGVCMLGSFKIGILLYCINIFSCFISVVILNTFQKLRKLKHTQADLVIKNYEEINHTKPTKNTLNIITQAASDTATSLLTVAFYIAFFYMIIDLLTNIKILQIFAEFVNIIISDKSISLGATSGFIEMTRGIQTLSITPNVLSLSIISFLLAFSGFSIIFQSLSFLNNTPLKSHKFIFGKLFQGIMSFCISAIIFSLFL